ncbi:VIT1/CCC1 transporter family protein [Candidatus Phycosocius spiralis]|uniref:Membrane protein n=1 Tax=Candidatus Phycosocius spiralis TaxID=2815099 RepID=A0ABQ4PXM5_9PROT|nr:VIT family protein [Candidatus Phycosocius spiralis]GIU67711.1 membrane protein [Candidatus Phycosocius spiralis]
MSKFQSHIEGHAISRIGWLRAAVLGANDGIVSTASLIVGVAAASATHESILLTGGAGLIAGAMSMAAGEYVSVSSQADSEAADISREQQELLETPDLELKELAGIYRSRGLTPKLAEEVAIQLTAHNALAAHTRDELGISEHNTAKPIQAALTSAATFSVGAALPLFTAMVAPTHAIIPLVSVGALVFLAILGGVGATTGGAKPVRAILRVTFWGALAMGLTAAIGHIMGATI